MEKTGNTRDSTDRAQIDKGSMKRVLGVGDLFAVGYGDLGSSIYYALGITALYAMGATPIALALAGLVFACTALTYAELSSMMKDSGGSATFSRHAFNDLISFIAGWGLLLDYIVTIAISSFAVAPYLSFFFSGLKHTENQILLTVCLIGILFIVNLIGTKHSAKMSWFLTFSTLITQAIIIVAGAIWLLNVPDVVSHLKINAGTSWSPTWPEFWKGVAMAMVAYSGIESMAQLSAEAKKPGKTVPRAIMWAMGTLLIVYLMTSFVALSAMSYKTLSTEYLENPIAGIVASLPFGGKVLGAWVGILAAIILFVAANAGLIGASRLCFNMGEYYQIPRVVYKLHPRFKTPYVSLGIFGALAAIIVIWSRGRLAFLADLYNFGAMLAFFSAHISLIMLRIKKPNVKRGFRSPLNITIKNISIPITAVLGGIVTAAVWVLVVITKPEGRNLGILWMVLGLTMYIVYRKKQRIATTAKVTISKIKMPKYKPTTFKRILVPTRAGSQTETVQMACQIAKLHKAEVIALFVVEIPFTLPLNAPQYRKPKLAEEVLKQAEAVAREYHVTVKLEMIHSRSIPKTVHQMVEDHDADLLVLGAKMSKKGASNSYGPVTDQIIRGVNCPVWVCFHGK